MIKMEMKDFLGIGLGIGAVLLIFTSAKKSGFAAESPGQGTGFSNVVSESGQHASSQNANSHVAQYKTTAAGYDVVGLSPDAPASTLKPCCRVPINAINPLIPLIPDAPFKTVETSYGGNRFGSLSRNSDDDTTMGRFGQLSLPPGLNDGYTDGTSTKTLSEWRQSLDLQRVSDTLFMARSMSGGENISLRRV
jgi:hypothetical protein